MGPVGHALPKHRYQQTNEPGGPEICYRSWFASRRSYGQFDERALAGQRYKRARARLRAVPELSLEVVELSGLPPDNRRVQVHRPDRSKARWCIRRHQGRPLPDQSPKCLIGVGPGYQQVLGQRIPGYGSSTQEPTVCEGFRGSKTKRGKVN